MLSPDIIQFIITQAGLAGIAYFSLLMLTRESRDHLIREGEMNKQLEFLLAKTLSTLEKNSEVLSALLQSINELSDRILYAESRNKRDSDG